MDPAKRLSELSLVSSLLLGGAALICFNVMKGRVFDAEWRDATKNFVTSFFIFSGSKWAWEILCYFVVVFFHFYIICFATRAYFTMTIVTNVCKYLLTLGRRNLVLVEEIL